MWTIVKTNKKINIAKLILWIRMNFLVGNILYYTIVFFMRAVRTLTIRRPLRNNPHRDNLRPNWIYP